MATKKKMLQAAAGNATGGAGLDVTEVFSTYLYDGNGSTQTITNDIDLAGEGGLVWLKGRNNGNSHYLHDSERTITKWLQSQTTAAEQTNGPVTSFNSNGFSLGFGQGNGGANSSGDTFASWTFRKAPKFFDVVTYTGDGTSGREIAHNLGCDVGFIVIKNTSSTDSWRTLHKDTNMMLLDTNEAAFTDAVTDGSFGDGSTVIRPTSTHFTVAFSNNKPGEIHVAYLFAHNDGDGGFGPDGDQDIIKCGSYTGNGSTDGPEIDLGFEPQWLLTKRATNGDGNWRIVDNMRGVPTGGNTSRLWPNENYAEDSGAASTNFTATGFKLTDNASEINNNGSTYIYMAIRRGPLAPPESATEVFDVNSYTGNNSDNAVTSGFAADGEIVGPRTISRTWKFGVASRLAGSGRYITSSSTSAEQTDGPATQFESNTGTLRDSTNMNSSADSPLISWMWKRAPKFFDVVAYTGNGVAGRTVSHNLGVAPEMLIVKSRSNTGQWRTYVEALGPTKYLEVQSTAAASTSTLPWNDTAPTATNFTLGATTSGNASGEDYIAYLFASLDGVSKVGSVTHTSGTATDVDCGFASGARFVLLKKTDATGGWYVVDTTRGIVSGNDPFLFLNNTDAEYTTFDIVDPYSSGFSVGPDMSSGNYIFYAIA